MDISSTTKQMIIVAAIVVIFALVAAGYWAYWQQKESQAKAAEDKKKEEETREEYKKLQVKLAKVEAKAKRQAERFTKLTECPKSTGIKEKYCTCSGDKCTCASEGTQTKEAYASPEGGMIPVRPMVNMVAGAVGKAKQLRAEQALRGAAAGLPLPKGDMLGKEAILTAGGKETFKPNKGMY